MELLKQIYDRIRWMHQQGYSVEAIAEDAGLSIRQCKLVIERLPQGYQSEQDVSTPEG